MSLTKKRIIQSAAGAIFGSVLSMAVVAAPLPIGSLQVENQVSVVSDAGKISVTDTYTLFSGDSIVTGEKGLAGLTLSQGGAIYVGEASSAKVTTAGEGSVVISLSEGTTGFSFESGTSFKVIAAGQEIVGSFENEKAAGAVSIDQNGEVTIQAIEGNLQAILESGERISINAGESFATVDQKEGVLVPVAVEEATPGLSGAAITGIVIGAGIVINEATDDDDETPAMSPAVN